MGFVDGITKDYMKNFRKALIVVLLLLSMVCLLMACNDGTDSQNGVNDQNTNTDLPSNENDGGNDTPEGGDDGAVIKPGIGSNNIFVFEPIANTKTCYLKSVSIFNSKVEIPSTNNGLTVVRIAPQVFYRNSVVEEITIPDTVEEIGERAFSLCVNLKKVNISPSSQLKKIGDRAFFQCELLHTFNLPTELEEVGEEAFSGCLDLINLNFPQSLVKVGAYAFHSGWLDTVTDLGVVYVAGVAYTYNYSPSDLTPKEVTLNDGTVAIAGKAFYDIDLVSSISIPHSVEYIGALALNNSKALTTISVSEDNDVYSSEGNALIEKATATLLATTPTTIVPAYVETIGEEAYAYLDGITTVTLPDSVTAIMVGAFKGSGVVNVNIPSGVTVIEEDTFLSCESLSSITIHSKIIQIKPASFNYCLSLEEVIIESETIYDILDTPYTCSGLIARANVVYVKEGLVGQADELAVSFMKLTDSDKTGYTKYVREN